MPVTVCSILNIPPHSTFSVRLLAMIEGIVMACSPALGRNRVEFVSESTKKRVWPARVADNCGVEPGNRILWGQLARRRLLPSRKSCDEFGVSPPCIR